MGRGLGASVWLRGSWAQRGSQLHNAGQGQGRTRPSAHLLKVPLASAELIGSSRLLQLEKPRSLAAPHLFTPSPSLAAPGCSCRSVCFWGPSLPFRCFPPWGGTRIG